MSVKVGSGFGGQWNMFNRPTNGLGGVILKNRAAGLCLDTGNGGTSTSVAVQECDGTPSQNWTIVSVPGTNFKNVTIQNLFTKKDLTTVLGSSTPNLPAFSSGSTKQHWADTVLVAG
ncbi:RICIN domain-containing protein [Streptomyces sp. NPDC056661]|uniref:RICIN domain-containing protein n=1 Tax=Streptomyces sp. NPDC056661 TaxID=3345898 RepID=UPI0036980812